MNIGKLAVTRPVAVTMRIAALVLLGIVSLTRLPLDLLPKVALPTVVVNTTWPNVAPEEMETQVTRPIEQAVSSASNVYLVSSQSSLGNSSVRIQFNYGTDISLAAVDVLQLVERARGRLPVDPTLQPPAVFGEKLVLPRRTPRRWWRYSSHGRRGEQQWRSQRQPHGRMWGNTYELLATWSGPPRQMQNHWPRRSSQMPW